MDARPPRPSDFNFLWRTFNEPFNVFEELGESRIIGACFPIYERLKRPLSKAKRDFTLIDSNREILVLFLGFIGFRLHPLGIDGLLGPHNNRTLRCSKFMSDHCVK
jgi:hypothetical protein